MVAAHTEDHMSDIGDDIKATADAIASDASTIKGIEEQKIELEADDPRLPQLSDQAVAVAEDLLQKAILEQQLVAEANSPS